MVFDAPDPEHRHRPAPGAIPLWLEWLTSLSALVISISSIFIAVHNSHDADLALEAQTYPYLEQGPSNSLPDGTARLSYDLANHGIGPANELSLRIKADGRYVRTLDDLVTAAVGPAEAPEAIAALHAYVNVVPTRFIPAGASQFLFQMTKTPENARWWRMMDRASRSWVVETCYCSVFNACWVRVDSATPRQVKACRRDEATEFKNGFNR